MNQPTETLADRLRQEAELAVSDGLDTLAAEFSASARRLLAQHSTLTKQDERIAALEAELEEVRGYYTSALDSERMWKAKAERYWQELQAERALADRLAQCLDMWRAEGAGSNACYCDAQFALHGAHPRHHDECVASLEALAAWKDSREKEARRE